jgi:glycosyltransferase involved in cell wall biosynthesis
MLEQDGHNPLVSVVVPCLNRAKYLVPTLESILEQDYGNVECIVVDGGSKDGTLDLLREYGGRIKWLSEPDHGPPDAINKGWKICRGEILAWLNADDLWAPGAVTNAVSYLAEHPEVDVVYGDCGLIDAEGGYLRTLRVADWNLRYAVEYCDHVIHQAASFMRRGILERVGWLYPKLSHDHELWLRISLAGGKMRRMPALLAYARDHSDNLGYRSDLVVPVKVGLTEEFFESPAVPPELAHIRRRALSNTYLRCIQYVLKDSLTKQELRRKIASLVWRAVCADPSNFLSAGKRLRKGLKRASRKSADAVIKRKRKSATPDLVGSQVSAAVVRRHLPSDQLTTQDPIEPTVPSSQKD